MSIRFSRSLRAGLACGVAVATLCLATTVAAQARPIQLQAQATDDALRALARQTGVNVLFTPGDVETRTSPAVQGEMTPEEAARRLVAGTGLEVQPDGQGGLVVRRPGASRPQSEAGAVPAEATALDDIIVTAQKREERIQDVPIAISAFSAETLEDLRIEGGSELLRAIPNVTFSKANFSMYNFSIRGIGTKAVSAASDPAVAVSFNNTPLIRNRLFEQEYLDVSRVEVLRGPQGTLYGRNATAGVVNMIPNLPSLGMFEGMAKAEVGNYGSIRGQGVINIPIGDTFAIRAAGSFTQRDGFDYNSFNDTDVNGRDLWSTRLSAAWEPTDRFRTNLIWEHFEEDDDRSRTGKQLCTRDTGPTEISGVAVPELLRGRFSQGCRAASLFDDAAYGAPDASGLAFIVAGQVIANIGYTPDTRVPVSGFLPGDPYRDVVQSRDLREISTAYDPTFRAENDVVQFNAEIDLTDTLTLVSQTGYARDRYFSSQDYNRFVAAPLFSDTNGLIDPMTGNLIGQEHASPGGIFIDPQLGPSDRLMAADLSRSRNQQWTQEFRLQSDFDEAFNFTLGANYLKFESQDDYFVFNNAFSYLAHNLAGQSTSGYPTCVPFTNTTDCVYVDENPIESLDELGHNYFLSRNIVEIESWAVFGEAYWRVNDQLNLTAGLRVTRDSKSATPIPSQLLLGGAVTFGSSGGYVNAGYPADPTIEQEWTEPTGRLVLDWTPDLSITDDTLIYVSLARGYKGGGTNPPRPGLNPEIVQFQPLPATFEPEFINAFEIGTKNTLDDGRITLNATAFFYDYEGYQVSQIVDRISLNENFDAKVWGLELETVWRPTPEWRFDANLGLLQTRVGDGEGSIDVMNRTQGNEDWLLLRPWIQVPSNCIAPREHVETILAHPFVADLGLAALAALCGGSPLASFNTEVPGFNLTPFFGIEYNPLTDAPNGGRGFEADLSGNELPNAPRWTLNIGVQRSFQIDDWELTVRGDYYRQADSYFRIYNTAYDKLEGWGSANLSVTLENEAGDWLLQGYVKNLFDDAPIVDAFTNSDDSGLTTNVFTLDPRLIAVSLTRRF